MAGAARDPRRGTSPPDVRRRGPVGGDRAGVLPRGVRGGLRRRWSGRGRSRRCGAGAAGRAVPGVRGRGRRPRLEAPARGRRQRCLRGDLPGDGGDRGRGRQPRGAGAAPGRGVRRRCAPAPEPPRLAAAARPPPVPADPGRRRVEPGERHRCGARAGDRRMAAGPGRSGRAVPRPGRRLRRHRRRSRGRSGRRTSPPASRLAPSVAPPGGGRRCAASGSSRRPAPARCSRCRWSSGPWAASSARSWSSTRSRSSVPTVRPGRAPCSPRWAWAASWAPPSPWGSSVGTPGGGSRPASSCPGCRWSSSAPPPRWGPRCSPSGSAARAPPGPSSTARAWSPGCSPTTSPAAAGAPCSASARGPRHWARWRHPSWPGCSACRTRMLLIGLLAAVAVLVARPGAAYPGRLAPSRDPRTSPCSAAWACSRPCQESASSASPWQRGVGPSSRVRWSSTRASRARSSSWWPTASSSSVSRAVRCAASAAATRSARWPCCGTCRAPPPWSPPAPSVLLTLDRDAFVTTVTGHRPTDAWAESVVADVLAEDARRG